MVPEGDGLGSNEPKDVGPAGEKNMFAVEAEIVGSLGADDGLALIESPVRPQRAIQWRDGDRSAPEKIEDGIEDHAISPQ
jgi:hypothetical protein